MPVRLKEFQSCLWKSVVKVGHVNAFLNLIRRALPGLAHAFECIRPSLSMASVTDSSKDLIPEFAP
jgi:hypothetical protein